MKVYLILILSLIGWSLDAQYRWVEPSAVNDPSEQSQQNLPSRYYKDKVEIQSKDFMTLGTSSRAEWLINPAGVKEAFLSQKDFFSYGANLSLPSSWSMNLEASRANLSGKLSQIKACMDKTANCPSSMNPTLLLKKHIVVHQLDPQLISLLRIEHNERPVMVWLNEHYLGSAEVLTDHLLFDIQEYLVPDTNRLVIGFMSYGKQDLIRPQNGSESGEAEFAPQISLEMRPKFYLSHININPAVVRDKAELEMEAKLKNDHAIPNTGFRMSLSVYDQEQLVYTTNKTKQTYVLGQQTKSLFFLERLPQVELWSLKKPKYYRLELRLYDYDSKITQVYSQYIGFNKPAQLKNLKIVNLSDIHPQIRLTNTKNVLQALKSRGINAIRTDQDVVDPELYPEALKVGFYLFTDFNFDISQEQEPYILNTSDWLPQFQQKFDAYHHTYGRYNNNRMWIIGSSQQSGWLFTEMNKYSKRRDNVKRPTLGITNDVSHLGHDMVTNRNLARLLKAKHQKIITYLLPNSRKAKDVVYALEKDNLNGILFDLRAYRNKPMDDMLQSLKPFSQKNDYFNIQQDRTNPGLFRFENSSNLSLAQPTVSWEILYNGKTLFTKRESLDPIGAYQSAPYSVDIPTNLRASGLVSINLSLESQGNTLKSRSFVLENKASGSSSLESRTPISFDFYYNQLRLSNEVFSYEIDLAHGQFIQGSINQVEREFVIVPHVFKGETEYALESTAARYSVYHKEALPQIQFYFPILNTQDTLVRTMVIDGTGKIRITHTSAIQYNISTEYRLPKHTIEYSWLGNTPNKTDFTHKDGLDFSSSRQKYKKLKRAPSLFLRYYNSQWIRHLTSPITSFTLQTMRDGMSFVSYKLKDHVATHIYSNQYTSNISDVVIKFDDNSSADQMTTKPIDISYLGKFRMNSRRAIRQNGTFYNSYTLVIKRNGTPEHKLIRKRYSSRPTANKASLNYTTRPTQRSKTKSTKWSRLQTTSSKPKTPIVQTLKKTTKPAVNSRRTSQRERPTTTAKTTTKKRKPTTTIGYQTDKPQALPQSTPEQPRERLKNPLNQKATTMTSKRTKAKFKIYYSTPVKKTSK